MKLLREPLLQIVILGLAVFAVYTFTSDRFETDEELTIRISPSDLDLLRATFERQWQRPPDRE